MNNVFGFLVGIERYDQPGWDVPGPCANAIAIAQWLLSLKVPAGNVYLFLNPVHDYQQAIAELRASGVQVRPCADYSTIDTFWRTELPLGRPPASRVLVYWSGHGFTENDGTRVFICSDYTAAALTNRVFSGTSLRRQLRSAEFACFGEQVFLADVCALYTDLKFEAIKFWRQPVPTTRQVAYFATPEGKYANGEDGVGAFTRVALEVLRKLGDWPDFKALSDEMDKAFQQAHQTPFRIDEFEEQHEHPNRLVGTVAEGAGSALFHSVWSLFSSIDLPDTVYRPHFLRTVRSLGNPELANAQGLSGMLRELASLCDAADTDRAPYGLIEFMVRLSGEAGLARAVNTWLDENTQGQQNALANARERIRLEGEEKILIVDVHNDAQGEVSLFEPSLRNQNLLPVPDIRLPSSAVTGWAAFQTGFRSVVNRLRTDHDVWDFQIHFLVNPPLFDKPFHRIPIDGGSLGEEFVVVVRYRDRLYRPSSGLRRDWRRYANALRGSKPSCVKVLPIPDPGTGSIELQTEERGMCYSRFAIPPASQCIREKDTLARLLRLGAPYLCWSHERPDSNDWREVKTCLTECLKAIETLDGFPQKFKNKRLSGNAAAQQATLLWDDPEFNPFIRPKGMQIR